MTRLALLLALVASLVAAAPASAATVTWSPGTVEPPDTPPEESCSRYHQCEPPSIRVTDDVGERNDLTLEIVAAAIVVRDAAARLHARGACASQPDGSVRCPYSPRVSVEAGGGDDRVVAPSVSVSGGEGDDDLTGGNVHGGPGRDTLTGGPDANLLDGGPGADVVDAGAGDDTVSENGDDGSADRLEGGEGNDAITFSRRAAAVRVDLAASPQAAGSAGEGNAVAGFESATGGGGDDELIAPAAPAVTSLDGSAGDDRLVASGGTRAELRGGVGDDELASGAASATLGGGPGSDVLVGGAGTELMYGSIGRDRLDAGGGDDRLWGDSGRDRLAGGTGADQLAGGTGADQLVGGGGRDLLAAGPGADSVFARDGRADRVRCGAGRDFAQIDRRERARGYERVSRPRRR